MKLKKDLLKIKEQYEIALGLIKNGKVKEAESVIYDKLGEKLYDMSLDIVYSKNLYMKELDEEIPLLIKQLRRLITKFDRLINTKIEYKDPDDLGLSKSSISVNSDDREWYKEEV
jgi:hypothetical protein